MSFVPNAGLRNAHIQSILASSPMRKQRLRRLAKTMLSQARPLLVEGGDGVQLLAFHSPQTNPDAPLAILIHGWEGTTQSGYLLSAANYLYRQGLQVVRLALRDHDDSHHLNRELFNSCRLQEVANGVEYIIERIAAPESFLAGFSLGGNFTVRVANELSARSVPLRTAAAVCPVIIPSDTMDKLEFGPKIYHHYFTRKWRKSLHRKSQLFPEFLPHDGWAPLKTLRQLTDYFVAEYTDYPSSEAYFDGYSLSVEKLSDLNLPLSILTSADDPIIDVDTVMSLQAHPNIAVTTTDHGGHCGFIHNLRFDCWADQFIFNAFRQNSHIL